jgi:hypothetical protein
MSINKDHFINQDMFLAERLNDLGHLGLSPFKYGLIPAENNQPALDVKADVDNQKVLKINLKRCSAITTGGIRINIPGKEWILSEAIINMLEFPGFSDNSAVGDYFVVLTVNPFKPDNWGIADPNEEPPRKPFTRPFYSISVMTAKDMAVQGPGPFMIPLHVFTLRGGQIIFDAGYVPPCMAIYANDRLMNFLQQVKKSLRSLENDSIKIVQKVRSKHQENILAQAISYLAEKIAFFASETLAGLNLGAEYNTPVYLIEKISSFARIVKTSIDTWQGNGKEEMLNYLTEWCDLNQGAFEKNLNDLIDLAYIHYDLRLALQSAENLMTNITPVFTILADLDYIGKKIDTNMFVKEDVIDDGNNAGSSMYEEETIKPKKGIFGSR